MTKYKYEIDLRPRFIDLWRTHHFRSDTPATMAEVDQEVILAMFRSEAVSLVTAEKVLTALSCLVEKEYTLDTVRVTLCKQTKGTNT